MRCEQVLTRGGVAGVALHLPVYARTPGVVLGRETCQKVSVPAAAAAAASVKCDVMSTVF